MKLKGQKRKLLANHPDALRVLVQSPNDEAADMLRRLKHSLRTVAEIEANVTRHSAWWDLNVHFVTSMPKTSAKTKVGAKARKLPEDELTGVKMRNVMHSLGEAAESQHVMHADAWVKLLEHTPAYEQVVVGKTGRMAVMRTLDPEVFVSVEHARQLRGGGMCVDNEQAEQQIQLVEELLEFSMVITKLDDSAKEALTNEVLSLSAAGEITFDRI